MTEWQNGRPLLYILNLEKQHLKATLEFVVSGFQIKPRKKKSNEGRAHHFLSELKKTATSLSERGLGTCQGCWWSSRVLFFKLKYSKIDVFDVQFCKL